MKQLHVCLKVLQYYAIVATEHAGVCALESSSYKKNDGLKNIFVVYNKSYCTTRNVHFRQDYCKEIATL